MRKTKIEKKKLLKGSLLLLRKVRDICQLECVFVVENFPTNGKPLLNAINPKHSKDCTFNLDHYFSSKTLREVKLHTVQNRNFLTKNTIYQNLKIRIFFQYFVTSSRFLGQKFKYVLKKWIFRQKLDFWNSVNGSETRWPNIFPLFPAKIWRWHGWLFMQTKLLLSLLLFTHSFPE